MTNEMPTNEVLLEKPVEETTVEAPKFDGMSNRAALEEAVKIVNEGKERPEKEITSEPSRKEVSQAVEADPEPPAEFSKAGKEAWKNKDIATIQKEFRRIHDVRTAEISRAQTEARLAREEGKTYRDLAKMAAPYIEARGSEGVSPEKAIMEALALIQEFKKGDPATVKAELRRIGIDLDKAPNQTAVVEQSKLEALQKTVEELKRDKEQQVFHKTVQTFDTIFAELGSLKTRTGDPVFPGLLDNSQAGIDFARELGSLTSDPGFRALVGRRFPNATETVVVREAYIALGGKVSGAPVTVSTQSNQKHIEKSRRATAAIPGRIAPRVNDSTLSGKLSKRAALAKAIEMHRGH